MEELTKKERDAVLKLNAEYRRAFFEEKVKQNGCFFILADDDGPVLIQDDAEGAEGGVVPVFTDEGFAKTFAESMKIGGVEPRKVSTEAYNKSWVPMLRDNKMELGFMPVGDEFETGVPDSL
ncbi:MAG: DUF2750 domain-containing protein [Aeromonadales bacterium]|nr:DUF2750 domain-containing protein [Aeromonadales bacterium]MDY2891346.1 DUF2750 domain-containing protein [Succinivibrio sp.]